MPSACMLAPQEEQQCDVCTHAVACHTPPTALSTAQCRALHASQCSSAKVIQFKAHGYGKQRVP